jgi:replicative DNA helicase
MARPELYDEVADVVDGDYFFSKGRGAMFAAVGDLVRRGRAVDVDAVDDALGDVMMRPSRAELEDLVATVPSAAQALSFAEQIAGAALVRRLVAAAAEIIEAGFEPKALSDPDAFADWAQMAVLAAGSRRNRRIALKRLVEVIDAALAGVRGRLAGELGGVPSGFDDLDCMTGGFRPGQLVVLGARPAMGKSAWALNVAVSVADRGGPVLLVSAEMAGQELGLRVLTSAGVPSDRLASGQIDDVDVRRLQARRDELADLPLFIDDTANPTLGHVRGQARRLATREALTLVVVDYVGLVTGEGRRERRELEVAAVSQGLKGLARELHVPVLALVQLNRNVEQRPDKRPMLSDLRDSGQQEADADLVLFLYRDAIYDRDADPGMAELIVAKHRNGPTGIVKLTWLPGRMTFENVTRGAVEDGW